MRWIIDLWMNGASIDEIENEFRQATSSSPSLAKELSDLYHDFLRDRYGI